MKKFLSIVLALIIIFALSGCTSSKIPEYINNEISENYDSKTFEQKIVGTWKMDDGDTLQLNKSGGGATYHYAFFELSGAFAVVDNVCILYLWDYTDSTDPEPWNPLVVAFDFHNDNSATMTFYEAKGCLEYEENYGWRYTDPTTIKSLFDTNNQRFSLFLTATATKDF